MTVRNRMPIIRWAIALGRWVYRKWQAWMHPAPLPRSAMFIELMKTKQWVDEALNTRGKGRMLIQLWSPPPRRSLESSRASNDLGNASQSTLEKLLARKREFDEQK